MDCDGRIKDLLPDFYLGQLPADEAEEVRHHLAEHAVCREALEEVAEVLDLMPYAAPATQPPVGLKERTLSRVLAQSAPVNAPVSEDPPRRREPAPRYLAPLAVAASVLVLFFAGFSYLSLERENDRLRAEVAQLQEEVEGGGNELAVLAVEGTGRAPDARGTVVIDASEGALALNVYNMPAQPEGHSFQAWLLEPGGEPVALGEMETDGRGDGRMAGTVSGPLTSYDAVQVTLEPEDSEALSGPVLLEGRL